MTDDLKRALTPDDDGRAFTDAVMLRAAGALHRRSAAAQERGRPALDWLAVWGRPWVLVSLIALAFLTLIPARAYRGQPRTASAASADSEAMVASLLPADMALATATEAIQER